MTAALTGFTLAILLTVRAVAFTLLVLHVLKGSEIPFVRLTSRKVRERTFTGENTLHALAIVHDRTGISLTRQLALHLRQTIDREVHRDVINTLEPIGRLTPGHMLKDDVIKLVHQNTELVFWLQLTHEVRIIKKLKLSSMRVDTHASGRDRLARGLVDTTRQSGEERLAHKQARRVHVQVERGGWFFGVVGHVYLS